jgi:intracellular sulfur oxidation DsrE/DsrF family protein
MKRMNTMMGALLGGAMVLGALSLPAVAQAADKARLVIQVSENDPATWNLALNNAKNVQKDLGKDNVDLEIVAYGPGINMLKADSEVATRIDEAADSGVHVMACQNTMRGQKLSKEDMNPKVGYVPSGVVEIMRRQQGGYAYLRP